MTIDFGAIAPEITLAVTAVVVLDLDITMKGRAKRLPNLVAALGTLVALGFTLRLFGGGERVTFGGMFVVDEYAVVFKLLFLGALLTILAVSWYHFAEERYYQGEYYFLLVAAFVGMLVLPSARDLLLVFVALETVSVPAFVMAGLRKRDLYSSEAAIKFFIIGVLAVSVMLFGMSLVYGFTGTTSLAGIADALTALEPVPLLFASLMLVIVGFGFKVSAVPFHFWAPDTYSGSPIPVTAMLAVASKAAGFAALAVVCFVAFEPYAHVWAPVLGVLGVLTMTVGNLVALQQRDIIRLLAYSSIAHAGYMLLPFGVAQAGAAQVNQAALRAVLFYLIAYAVMNLGAFAVAVAVNRRTGARAIADYAGLGERSPLLALGFTFFLISLGGLPPLVGLWAKVVVFQALVLPGTTGGYVLAVFLVLNTVLSLFYYLAVVRTMWFDPSREGALRPRPGFVLAGAVTLLMAATLVLGVLPLFLELPIEMSAIGAATVP